MLLQPTTSKPPLYLSSHQNHFYSNSFPSGFHQNSTFPLRQAVVFTTKTNKNLLFITRSSISHVHSYGTVDYEKRPAMTWNAIYKRISMMENPHMDSASVLNQVENEGKNLTKWELCRVVKELRKFRRYKYALEVYEWMNNRGEKYRITTSDTAIQLDLIAKVHGISNAEEYFMKSPDALKDKRIYGALLNAYVRAGMREKAEFLIGKMRNRGYASHALPFNVMMTLYMNLKDYERVESLISEMMEKNISLDIYSYNIWLSSCGSQGSLEKLEQAFEQMQLNTTINPNWTTFSTMATMYIKLGKLEKAEDCLKKIETRITGRDRIPYHYLMSLYGSLGIKEEVHRVWNIYKATFTTIPNLGYHAVISSLVRLDDIEGAESIYDEWLSVKSVYDPRIGNLLLSSYVRKGLSEKAKIFFDQMIEAGGKPSCITWEIISEHHIKSRRISDAVSCLKNAASAGGSKGWKPKPVNVSSILKISEQEADMASKDGLLEVLKQVGCLDDEVYMSYIPLSNGIYTGSDLALEDGRNDGDDVNDGANVVLSQLQESL
ncbi:pentatricopeptide repeat-containing protein At1g02150-like [Olea europaea var. sylvestris]|uniref:pentatricopeptide repeat-containing protein At1g02150-like n=1 Tax=Olea europaea var. sylvestris TaxID=158386 RepID=UPI000C1D69F9|nr:pentatricopeptide repeat-containing protein At1g02150-like [Olea europaea var. sylvestris]